MDLSDLNTRGIVLLGCGKMGSALLEGWLANGVAAKAVHVIDPNPSDWLKAQGVALNADIPASPAVMLIAVKPQLMDEALQGAPALGGADTLVVSVAAGVTLARFEESFGTQTPIIRTMPNTPAAIGQGITAIISNAAAGPAELDLAEAMMRAVGDVVRLEHEDQMDAVTAVSGSGPAYVFHMIEAMAAAGVVLGLPAALAGTLAARTVAGAGALAVQAGEAPEVLRRNVTSPGGTTQAALEVLMDADGGLSPLMERAMAAAARRSKELSNG